MMLNGFLSSQGFPKYTQFDIQKPSETLSNMINYGVKESLKVEIDALPYIKPTVQYIRELLKLGQNREFLQQINTTQLSNRLTDTLNMEVNSYFFSHIARKYN